MHQQSWSTPEKEMEFEDPYKYTSFSRDPIEEGIVPENPQPTSILHLVIVS